MSLGNALLPLVSAGSVLSTGSAYLAAHRYGYGARYWMLRDRPDLQQSYRASVRLRRDWKAMMWWSKLILKDDVPRGRDMQRGHTRRQGRAKIRTPKLQRVTYDEYGLSGEIKLVPTVRTRHFEERCEDFANRWGMVRVSVRPLESNTLRIRAVRRDPLQRTFDFVPSGRAPESLDYYPAGFDQFGDPHRVRIKDGSGIALFGLPRSGKTSFINGLLTWAAPSDSVVLLIADGKTTTGSEGDYFDIAPRALSVIGADPFVFNDWVKQIERLRAMRAATIRQSLGVRNFWDVGPSPEWPLIMPVIDECNVFFEQVTAGGDWRMGQRNAIAASNAYLISNLVRMGSGVGILPVLATQKGVAESIPTIISHNCHDRLCFPVQSDEAAVAALRKDILKYPEANPANFQSRDYVGVATTPAPERRGYLRVRTPFCRPQTTADIAEATAHLVRPDVCPGLDIGRDHHTLLGADDMEALLAGDYTEGDQ